MPPRKSPEQFILEAIEVHGDKFDYSKLGYTGGNKKITIICNACKHEFTQQANHHLSGFGCSECSGNRKKTKIDMEREGNILYHGMNDYSKVGDFKNNKSKVEIICKSHGSFFKSYYDHIIKKFGCPDCNTKVNTTKKFIAESIITHGNLYGYELSIYINNKTAIEIICHSHGSFWQMPSDHMDGAGCPECKISRGERKICNWLTDNKIDYTYNKSFEDCRNPKTNRKLKFDFYIPTKSILIEFDGRQHFEETATPNFSREPLRTIQYRDNIKNEYAKNKNIRLLRISYKELENINNILEKELCHLK